MSTWREVEIPKIWVSRFHKSMDLVYFDSEFHREPPQKVHLFSDLWQRVPSGLPPKFLFFENDESIPDETKDAFRVIDGLLVVSKALCDVLVQFEIGDCQLFEVPICVDVSGKRSGLPNHFVLNVHSPKETVILALSEGIEQIPPMGQTEPFPTQPWASINRNDILAVRGEAADGADLWHDPMIECRFFLSDRLKLAIDAANLNTRALDLHPARVFKSV